MEDNNKCVDVFKNEESGGIFSIDWANKKNNFVYCTSDGKSGEI